MPTDALPPSDVGTSLPSLVYWVMTVLVLVTGALWYNTQRVRDRHEQLLREQKDDAKETAASLTKFEGVLTQVLEVVKEIARDLRESK